MGVLQNEEGVHRGCWHSEFAYGSKALFLDSWCVRIVRSRSPPTRNTVAATWVSEARQARRACASFRAETELMGTVAHTRQA